MSDQNVVLITGASSGVGQSTARLLVQEGYKVFGTSRNPVSSETIPTVEMLALDVRDDASVAACVKTVVERAGRIDVLINNAAYEQAGALEEISIEEARSQFETNFFGVMRMIKAVLPLMRRQKQGLIINVSSVAGTSSLPFMGIYSASKFALEGYTEALRMELKPLNIQVSLTEAGFLKTPMMNKRQTATTPINDYDSRRQHAFAAFRNQEEKAPGPELVAETILRIISSKTPRLHNLIGLQARLVTSMRWILPAGTFERAKLWLFQAG